MGFIMIGIGSITDMGLNGALLQIISHGFIGAALFFLAGTTYDRIRLVYLDEMGGIAIPMSKIFTMFSSFSMASLALPGGHALQVSVQVISSSQIRYIKIEKCSLSLLPRPPVSQAFKPRFSNVFATSGFPSFEEAATEAEEKD
ncbi:NAD(P)H-quinone oxidoreductase chain 4, chloroplastic-like [Henckelia pumila]|uniref:NAD(P)H-quinone oxidoreductase chain 4, chloroplastic-like n=1 Tax=Henckelia pumila TaxID=405737 RepID=UPI003C6E1C94